MNSGDPTFERLEDQIAWYDRKSSESQRRFKLVKGRPADSRRAHPRGGDPRPPRGDRRRAGRAVVLLEGFAQLGQYQQNWSAYRSTCEALKHEKYLFLGEAGPYAGSPGPRALLADRIEGLISQEHAKWVSAREEAAVALQRGPDV